MNSQLTKLIKVKDDTYERLSNRGKKNETYDDIIRKLLDLTETETNKK
jgi:predicted CopG family antitoxin